MKWARIDCLKVNNSLFRLFLADSKRINHPQVFWKKGFLRNFAKFKGKHLCQSLFFNKSAGMRTATLLKKSLWYRCFPVNIAKFPRTPFFIEHLRWLLLNQFTRNSLKNLLLNLEYQKRS